MKAAGVVPRPPLPSIMRGLSVRTVAANANPENEPSELANAIATMPKRIARAYHRYFFWDWFGSDCSRILNSTRRFLLRFSGRSLLA